MCYQGITHGGEVSITDFAAIVTDQNLNHEVLIKILTK